MAKILTGPCSRFRDDCHCVECDGWDEMRSRHGDHPSRLAGPLAVAGLIAAIYAWREAATAAAVEKREAFLAQARRAGASLATSTTSMLAVESLDTPDPVCGQQGGGRHGPHGD